MVLDIGMQVATDCDPERRETNEVSPLIAVVYDRARGCLHAAVGGEGIKEPHFAGIRKQR